ncbi:hypothetical protein [Deinococcus aluminii]|uniref:Uncharacterized protein n=1 Tax=Deinococcus aluminii TaxID=1656885 RepID=A0ABP9XA61_9DEIO
MQQGLGVGRRESLEQAAGEILGLGRWQGSPVQYLLERPMQLVLLNADDALRRLDQVHHARNCRVLNLGQQARVPQEGLPHPVPGGRVGMGRREHGEGHRAPR